MSGSGRQVSLTAEKQVRPRKDPSLLFPIDPCGEAAGNWLIGFCSEQEEQERGRRCGGGAKRPWLLLGYSISRARLWTAVPLTVLWNRRRELRRGRAGQGRPGHACGRSGKEPLSGTSTHAMSPCCMLTAHGAAHGRCSESLPEAMANILRRRASRPVTGVSQAIPRGCLLAFRGWSLFTSLLLLASSTRHQHPPPLLEPAGLARTGVRKVPVLGGKGN
jgi:hypothetical protein